MMMRQASVSGSRYAMGMRLGEVCDPPPSMLHISIIDVIIVILMAPSSRGAMQLERLVQKYFLILARKPLKESLENSANFWRFTKNFWQFSEETEAVNVVNGNISLALFS